LCLPSSPKGVRRTNAKIFTLSFIISPSSFIIYFTLPQHLNLLSFHPRPSYLVPRTFFFSLDAVHLCPKGPAAQELKCTLHPSSFSLHHSLFVFPQLCLPSNFNLLSFHPRPSYLVPRTFFFSLSLNTANFSSSILVLLISYLVLFSFPSPPLTSVLRGANRKDLLSHTHYSLFTIAYSLFPTIRIFEWSIITKKR
jgi:hypothetical protein